MKSFYPVLITADVVSSSRWFRKHLGFEETFCNEWYVSLKHRERQEYEIAFVDRTHESVPADHRATSNLLLNVEVEDATLEFERLQGAGMRLLLPLRDEPWGQRHFIGVVPGGVLLDVIEVIPAAPDFAAQYAG